MSTNWWDNRYSYLCRQSDFTLDELYILNPGENDSISGVFKAGIGPLSFYLKNSVPLSLTGVAVQQCISGVYEWTTLAQKLPISSTGDYVNYNNNSNFLPYTPANNTYFYRLVPIVNNNILTSFSSSFIYLQYFAPIEE